MKINQGGSFLFYPERGYHEGIVDHVFQKTITSFGYDINKTFCYSLVSYAPFDVGLNNLENVKTNGFLCVQEIYPEHHRKIEARINLFDIFNFWIDVHKLHEALDYTKFQVNLLRGNNKVEM
uniref:Uncharacterized protein n=1 Tax=Lactuca sativa TaxID=4236 RepID=A0A9R1WBQ9_LACSA|nr:hypothetical protein LSAT_V11C200056180 [Lactuca sativa]